MTNITVLSALNQGIMDAFASNERVVMIGEDILDPYGGAFKVTNGLSTLYPDRVFSSPISEAGIVGLATGMALRGFRPVVEIMFGDFTTLILDQVLNHLAKFNYMYNEQVNVPVIIRTPMGGRRGYGATHSQTIEKIFLGIPDIQVISPTALGNPGELLYDLITKTNVPTLFVENKLLYSVNLHDSKSLSEFQVNTSFDQGCAYPIYQLSLAQAPSPQVTIASYGYMTELVLQAVETLAYEYEIICETIIYTQLAPFKTSVLSKSLEKTGNLLVVEESTQTMGWGAEISARTKETLGHKLKAIKRVGADDSHIPAARELETAILPGVENIIEKVVVLKSHNV